jgi:hypothetical protein
MNIAPDTLQNIFYTLYFTLTHNFIAIIYTLGIIVATLIGLRRPSRAALILLWGFVILLFAFEYNKHILEPLKEQTINSLITERQSYRLERLITVVLEKAIPLFLPIIGWILVIGSSIGLYLSRKSHDVSSKFSLFSLTKKNNDEKQLWKTLLMFIDEYKDNTSSVSRFAGNIEGAIAVEPPSDKTFITATLYTIEKKTSNSSTSLRYQDLTKEIDDLRDFVIKQLNKTEKTL